MYEVVFLPAVVTEIICLGIRIRVSIRVSVNSFRDSFSVLLRAQHYSLSTTAGQ